jgi:dUTP pyrophosphatase
MKVKIIRIDKTLPLPEYQTEGAVAFDLYTRVDSKIEAQSNALLPSNFIIEVPKGHALILASRSSTYKKGLQLVNGIGVIDQDYHGPNDEIFLAVRNYTDQDIDIVKGDRIAQGLIIPVAQIELEEVDGIKDSSRGGFGSTGN